jgi:hypothetical protein
LTASEKLPLLAPLCQTNIRGSSRSEHELSLNSSGIMKNDLSVTFTSYLTLPFLNLEVMHAKNGYQ